MICNPRSLCLYHLYANGANQPVITRSHMPARTFLRRATNALPTNWQMRGTFYERWARLPMYAAPSMPISHLYSKGGQCRPLETIFAVLPLLPFTESRHSISANQLGRARLQPFTEAGQTGVGNQLSDARRQPNHNPRGIT